MRQVDEMVRERMRERKRFCFLFFLGRGGVDEEEAKKGGGGGRKGGRARRFFHREPAAILLREGLGCSMTVPWSFK